MAEKKEYISKYFQYYKNCPVKKRTVFYHAYRTRIMAGNPYAIFAQLMKDEKFSDYNHYWVYSTEDQLEYDTFSKYKDYKNVHYVKNGSDEHMEALATCEYLIDNAALPSYWIKRSGQISINTWHGTPLKSIGLAAKDSKYSSISNAQRNFMMCDYLVLPNNYTIEKMLESYDTKMCPGRTILDAGYPRIDLVLNADKNHVIKLLEKKSGQSLKNKKIVLYAPTFRSEQGKSMNTSQEMFEKIDEIMENLPKDYVMFFKIHNTLGAFFAEKKGDIRNYLIFDEIETNELLSVVDVLITDYSSIFFDYLCTKKPILFFAYDREEYESQHGIYVDMESLPGQLCYTASDVVDKINEIKAGKFEYVNQKESFDLFAYNDDGKASKRVVDAIFNSKVDTKYVYDNGGAKDNRKQILISLENQIQPAYLLLLRRVLNTIDSKKYSVDISTIDKDVIKPFCEKYFPDIQILLSPVAEQMEDTVDENYLSRQCEKFFYGKKYDYYYNLKPRETDIDKYVSGFKGIKRKWFMNEDDYSAQTIKHSTYKYEQIEVIHHKEDTKLKENQNYKIINRRQLLSEKEHRMTALVLADFDSMNYSLLPCIQELEKRNCDVLVITRDINDKNNNKIFLDNGIPLYSIFDIDNAILCYTDIILTAPTRNAVYNSIMRGAIRRNVFIASFSMLFSSIVMKSYPDIVFTLGENKKDEFADNYLRYNCVATGNPQYDQLLSYRKKDSEDIKKVLIIDQGGYPYGSKGKQQLADTLVRIAKAHPEMQFDIKPRYLPGDTSQKTHNISEHLYDYIKDAPDNLNFMTYATILEEIVVDYDAMITTWSTAYLDALVLNIPIILIDGLDSIDVFDVRKQRIKEAYDKLRLTGCVYNYKELGKGKDEFKLINKEYADKEIYNVEQNSTNYVVDVLMQIYENILSKGKSIDDEFSCNAEEFSNLIKKLKTVDCVDEDYINKKKMLYYTNEFMQKYVYRNRCMGYLLNLTTVREKIDALCKEKIVDFKSRFETAKLGLEDTMNEVVDNVFSDKNVLEQVNIDPVLQSYYIQWLFLNDQYKELIDFKESLLVPQCRDYFLASYYLRFHKFKAYRYLFSFLDIVNQSVVCQTVWDRRVSITPFRTGLINKTFFYGTIIFKKKYYLLPMFADGKLNRNSILCLMRMKYNNEIGEHEDNIRLFTNFESIFSKSMKQRKKRSLKGKCRLFIKKRFFEKIKREYNISVKKGE